jgi:hypothetical protein
MNDIPAKNEEQLAKAAMAEMDVLSGCLRGRKIPPDVAASAAALLMGLVVGAVIKDQSELDKQASVASADQGGGKRRSGIPDISFAACDHLRDVGPPHYE